ncbi:MAG: RDD family protein [Daejeonella sp.]
MAEYYVVINGKPDGPYSTEELKNLKILPGTFLKTPGMDDYKEAHELAEVRELLGWSKTEVEPQYFATLDVRLLAVIIDYFILFAVYLVLAFLVLAFLTEKDLKIRVAVAGLAIIPIAKLIYGSVMEASSRQASFGKVLMSVKVTDEKGGRISITKSLIRNFSKLICMATLGLGYLMGFFDKRQQCLHDKIAGTLVVKDRLL